MTVSREQLAALEPLQEALRAQARRTAAAIRSTAEADGRAELAAAERARTAAVEEAAARGRSDARETVDAMRRSAVRQGRLVVQQARRAAYQESVARAREVLAARLSEPQLRARLGAAISDALGPDAAVTGHPDGGLVGQAPDGRTIVASVAALIERCLAGGDAAGVAVRS